MRSDDARPDRDRRPQAVSAGYAESAKMRVYDRALSARRGVAEGDIAGRPVSRGKSSPLAKAVTAGKQGGGSGRGIARARYDPDPVSDRRSAVPIGNNIRIMSAGGRDEADPRLLLLCDRQVAGAARPGSASLETGDDR